MYKVSAVDCSSYESEEVYDAVKEALNWIGFTFPEGKTVFIKPNIMSQNAPDQHTVTHFSLVEALCRLLKENNCKIKIGDSIAFYQKGLTRRAFETTKIGHAAKKYGAELIALDEEPLVKIDSGITVLKELYIPRVILQADLVVDLCKLKTHGSMRLSGALKNMFGCLPGGYKQKIHLWTNNPFELSDVFLDIHSIIKPVVCIMDAVVSLDGGPSAIGRPVHTSKIMASHSAAALDVAACKITGYEPEDISTLIRAKDRGLISDFKDVEIMGSIETFKFKSIMKGEISREKGKDGMFVTETYVIPEIDQSRCTVCRKCMDICAVGCIDAANDMLKIDHGKCILCYCCISRCSEDAIKITSSHMNKFIRAMRMLTKI